MSSPEYTWISPAVTVPAPNIDAPTPAGGYLVAAGDTLRAIAAARGVSLADLLNANPSISNPDIVHAGQPISIPASVGDEQTQGFAVVKPGDSLRKISDRHGFSLADVLAVNPGITNPDLIHAGQRIKLPR